MPSSHPRSTFPGTPSFAVLKLQAQADLGLAGCWTVVMCYRDELLLPEPVNALKLNDTNLVEAGIVSSVNFIPPIYVSEYKKSIQPFLDEFVLMSRCMCTKTVGGINVVSVGWPSGILSWKSNDNIHLETWSEGVRSESKFSKFVTTRGSVSQIVKSGLRLPGSWNWDTGKHQRNTWFPKLRVKIICDSFFQQVQRVWWLG